MEGKRAQSVAGPVVRMYCGSGSGGGRLDDEAEASKDAVGES
jgi:hypothetical protein